MKSEDSTEIVAAVYTTCPLYTQNCATPGGSGGKAGIKEIFIKTTNKNGKFWKIPVCKTS